MMSLKQGGEMQAKGIRNIFNKMIAATSQILRRRCLFRYRRPLEQQTDMT
jgi:hypothetical protein